MTSAIGGSTLTQDLRSVQVGVFGGLFACLAYALMVSVPLPRAATVALVAFFGPALGVASFGLSRLLNLKEPLVTSSLGAMLNALAGALFSAMGLVQLAVVYSIPDGKPPLEVKAIWQGLDVAWDGYIGLGTICFGMAMLRHPRFGRVFGVSGIVIGAGLLALNLWTFPSPPVNAGLVDLGPAIGLWYFVVMIRMASSFSWVRGQAAALSAAIATKPLAYADASATRLLDQR